MRRIRNWFLCKVFAIITLIIFIVTLSFRPREEVDRYTQILNIERSIASPLNGGVCFPPLLSINNPEIMRFYEPVAPIDCGNSCLDWVACEQSICSVKPEILAAYGEVTCSYTDILRISDHNVKFGQTTETKTPFVLRHSDFVNVACHSENMSWWYGMVYDIQHGLPPPSNSVPKRVSYFNVLMLGFDSLSRHAFIRKLPKSYNYLMSKLQAIVLKDYNIVGDGKAQALIPILTGHKELELPETRENKPNSTNVDVYRMIWHDYARQGYYTAFNEDMPQAGTFTYRLKGFKEQPTNHYMRTFYVALKKFLYSTVEHCIGYQADHVVMLDYTMKFMKKYRDAAHFAFSFHGGLSQNSINLIGAADDDILQWLKALKEKHLLDDTILIIMSDHGNRFEKVRATLQGKQEERLPFFSFTFPPNFKLWLPVEYDNFVKNSKRLTTPFDIHATLKDILRLQNTLNPSYEHNPVASSIKITKLAEKRAISLFNIIPKNRSCAEAYIEPHWCACLDWSRLSTKDPKLSKLLKSLANSIVAVINEATEAYRQLCEPFKLKSINWALKLQPTKALLEFTQSGDKDGFEADLSGTTHITEEFYHLQVLLDPGEALFEASVHKSLNTSEVLTKLTELSRVNKYGNQASCMYERNPEMREYCYCRRTNLTATRGK